MLLRKTTQKQKELGHGREDFSQEPWCWCHGTSLFLANKKVFVSMRFESIYLSVFSFAKTTSHMYDYESAFCSLDVLCMIGSTTCVDGCGCLFNPF